MPGIIKAQQEGVETGKKRHLRLWRGGHFYVVNDPEVWTAELDAFLREAEPGEEMKIDTAEYTNDELEALGEFDGW